MAAQKKYHLFIPSRLPRFLIVIMLLFHFGITDFGDNSADIAVEIVDDNGMEDEKDSEENLVSPSTFDISFFEVSSTCFYKCNKTKGSNTHYAEIPSPPPDQL